MVPDTVIEKLAALPAAPGVYLFKDKKGVVVYVGKAKSLRSRVKSYFQPGSSDERYFIPLLQSVLGDFDTIVTSTEKEATILENTLIKEHRPRYNVKLRDDKDFLCLRLAAGHAWPRLDVVRRPSPDGARYFGPYHSATSARRTLHLVNKHFQLRTCSDAELAARRRPCLQHQIKRCPAPCVYEVDKGWYGEQVEAVAKFLGGKHDELSLELADRMKDSARRMRFELAAVYRDQLHAIDKVREEQRVVAVDDMDRDVVGLYREGDLVELVLLYVRSGKLADVATFSIKQAEIPDEEIIAAFLAQHYERMSGESEDLAKASTPGAGPGTSRSLVPIPGEIIVPIEPEALRGIEEWLADRAGHKVSILQPKRGARVDLLALARDNASHAFSEKRRQSDDVEERLSQLQERLRLPTLPRRIECCDISHLGGGDTVGAVVAMKDGQLDKKRYRTFNVRGATESLGDDYAAMYEVLARRFRRSITTRAEGPLPAPAETEGTELTSLTEAEAEAAREKMEWELPDLFVVDGGRGQLAVALAAARDLGLHEMPIVALAKEKENVLGETLVDRVYIPGQKNPIPLKSHSASLFFLARLRDEAHRFSNRARKRVGKARRFRSELDGIAGIGPATKKALLRALGSVVAVKAADDEALLAVSGVSSRHVKALRKAFPQPSMPNPSDPAPEERPPTQESGPGDGPEGKPHA
jgi:excinuclease ABC subunit C